MFEIINKMLLKIKFRKVKGFNMLTEAELPDFIVLNEQWPYWDSFYSINEIEDSIDPIIYFLKNWKLRHFVFVNEFSTEIYLNENSDLNLNDMNLLVHYILFGKNEGRNGFHIKRVNNNRIPDDIKNHLGSSYNVYQYEVLLNSNINWAGYFTFNNIKQMDCEDPILHYILNWKDALPVLPGVFDTDFYLRNYKDIYESNINPLVHFIEEGESEGRLPFSENSLFNSKQQLVEYKSLKNLGIDWTDYYKFNNIKVNVDELEPLSHYILNWESLPLIVPGFFDTTLYLEQYPDIKKSKSNPLMHFALHGKNEGRIGYFDINRMRVNGGQPLQPELSALIVVSHESSATGAPLVGYNIGNELNKEFNIIHIIIKESNLNSEFISTCHMAIQNIDVSGRYIPKKILHWLVAEFDIAGVICNSVETFPLLDAANSIGLPTVSLIHEFSEYTRPKGKIAETVIKADRVIFPSKIVRDSAIRELASVSGIKNLLNNISIYPQGKLPFIPEGHGSEYTESELLRKLNITEYDLSETKILVGAGYVQIRKGVDLFISAAKQIKETYSGNCKFVWVGDGYAPDTDLNYSNWLKIQIEQADLENDFVFLGHQRNLDQILKITDVFCLTSRLDPFPNVIVDALNADVHVACFEKATGCADFMITSGANCTVVDYLDTYKFAIGVITYLNSFENTRSINRKLVEEKLNFGLYLNFLKEELNAAHMFRQNVNYQVEELLSVNEFDFDYFSHGEPIEKAVNYYVQSGLKGIHHFNPKPGFSEFLWLFEQGKGNFYQVPLYQALISDKKLQTHNCIFLDSMTKNEVLLKKKYAIHLHLFYIELAGEFVEYFSDLPKNFDIYVTHINSDDHAIILDLFSTCGANNVYVKQVENQGRDIVPLFASLKDEILQGEYDFIGHFHTKKSLEISETMGDQWRKFLMNTLVGNNSNSSNVLSLFINEKIGLIFAEDRHCVNQGQNHKYITEVCNNLKIDVPEDTFIFPLGTMFWARIEALRPLFNLDYSNYNTEEPLPYDGSHLHAIERLLPAVTISSGFEFVTVHKNGENW